ncbi:hypothetical protein [Streptomyces sp. PT12]|uniref:hypothetical protein n=1 Tax=Streptomyces sp. PT12 TaxID=1510197 RepID=UPI000DE577AB|nr:hypothetical protein [Streptomyces sp. PT12]RBM19536.1 hypothetical protein DEH69_10610 [Streptomyces sp. PT12]
MRKTTGGRPHRFEPPRLVFGLVALTIALLHVLRATGNADVPLPVLFALLPLGLLCTAAVAMAALTARRARRRAVERGR